MSPKPRKQIILAAHFPGVNHTTVWGDPRSRSQIEFSSFVELARTAERAKFDFFFLAEGLRLREQRGRIHDLDVVGRPDALTVLAGLAAVTDHLGLIGTMNATFRDPYELARELATLDHLSGGRAGWNVVTSSDGFFGTNFRKGGFLAHPDRYERAREFVEVSRLLWDSWAVDEVVADPETGQFVRRGDPGAFAYRGSQFDVEGRFNVPASPQGHPVVLQAGNSDAGRELAAATADGVFTIHATLEAGRAFFADVKGRLARYGREPDELKVLPGATVVVADTDDDAVELAREIRFQQVTPQTAIALLEQVWNRDLSSYDPDGPLPDIDPEVEPSTIVQGRARIQRDPLALAERWRAIAAEKHLSIRELMVETMARHTFVGSPESVADQIDTSVQTDAADGFILVPHLTPGGLDPFVDRVVPLLQERGAFRSEYESDTLRGNLGLGPARRWQADPTPASVGAR